MGLSYAQRDNESRNVSATQYAPIFNAPDAVKWIAGATLLAHLGRVYLLPGDASISLMVELAFVPGRYSTEFISLYGLSWPTFASPLTHMLVHGDFTHLLVNVLLFLAFGAAVGRRMAARPMLVFYILCGLPSIDLLDFQSRPFGACHRRVGCGSGGGRRRLQTQLYAARPEQSNAILQPQCRADIRHCLAGPELVVRHASSRGIWRVWRRHCLGNAPRWFRVRVPGDFLV